MRIFNGVPVTDRQKDILKFLQREGNYIAFDTTYTRHELRYFDGIVKEKLQFRTVNKLKRLGFLHHGYKGLTLNRKFNH